MSSKGIRRTCMLMALVRAQSGVASDMQFFNDHIDYWKEKKTSEDRPKIEKAPGKTQIDKTKGPGDPPSAESSFQWQKFLDPRNKEFFKEGDYTPPEPFMELVRDPSDQNIKLWFSYMQKKNALAERLAKRMEEYAAKNQAVLPGEAKTKISEVIKQMPVADDEFERYRFRMYFDSTCPHCQHMIATLNDLQDRGYFVEAKQIDKGSIEKLGAHVAISPATPEELKKFRVTSVPLLVIGDLKAKKVFRQSGYMEPDQVLQAIRGSGTSR